MFTAMSFAELSSAIPRASGAYNFARIGFGRGTNFLAGWMEWFASSVACRNPKSVVMVKSDTGVRSWIRRWI